MKTLSASMVRIPSLLFSHSIQFWLCREKLVLYTAKIATIAIYGTHVVEQTSFSSCTEQNTSSLGLSLCNFELYHEILDQVRPENLL